jgi:hypothetical protein
MLNVGVIESKELKFKSKIKYLFEVKRIGKMN